MHKSQGENWRDRLPEPPNRIAAIKKPYSPGRMEWLRKLESATKPLRRIRGHVAGDCLRLGWTDYVVLAPDRSRGPFEEMRLKHPGKVLTETMAHTITAAGREALKAWEEVERG